jgi:hypothetical protein
MTCGIICKRDVDYEPWPEVADGPEPEPDLADKILRGFLVFLCIINIPVLIAAALVAEFA